MERYAYVVTLVAAVGMTLLGLITNRDPLASRLLTTASAVFGIASILQLRISGWFDAVLREYGDDVKYPYGPPSHITRQIIDDPDHPIQTAIRNFVFFEPDTGAYLGIVSLLIAILATWK